LIKDKARFQMRLGYAMTCHRQARNIPRKISRELPESRVKFGADFRGIPAKMSARRKSANEGEKLLDAVFPKRKRGRPYKVVASEVSGRAYNYRLIFSQTWEKIGDELLNARTEEDVIRSFENTPYQREFQDLTALILRVLREKEFPKKNRKAQTIFLAESLAARGDVSPRTSRDICAKARKRERAKSRHHIIRYEFYVECSCGYKGPARDNACRKCGAEIIRPLAMGF
jgi:hypothetical protein